jgi:iron-sulfur cluster assembly protein
MITVTDSAVKQLQALMQEKEAEPGMGLRIFVESGGCAGMQYGMTLDATKEGDEIIERDGVRVIVDAESAGYLQGSVIDYADGLAGAGFKINNPNATRSCGCGTSFEPATGAEAGEQAGKEEHAH